MPARLSTKQAKQLGLPGVERTTPKGKKKRDRSTVPAKECLDSRCVTCGEQFAAATAEAKEARHLADTGHVRYESVLEGSNDASDQRVPDV